MKHLPLNWADQLTIEDVQDILAHFQQCLVEYRAGSLHPFADEYDIDFNRRQIPHVMARIRLWTDVMAAKRRGEPVQELVNYAKRSGQFYQSSPE